jgi:hypothetical protein
MARANHELKKKEKERLKAYKAAMEVSNDSKISSNGSIINENKNVLALVSEENDNYNNRNQINRSQNNSKSGDNKSLNKSNNSVKVANNGDNEINLKYEGNKNEDLSPKKKLVLSNTSNIFLFIY